MVGDDTNGTYIFSISLLLRASALNSLNVMMRFDLLIKGGQVVDPGGGQHGRMDVAISRNRIAAIDSNIPAESAARVIDAAGQYVTPGLVDLHTHVYHHVTFWGIEPDPVAA